MIVAKTSRENGRAATGEALAKMSTLVDEINAAHAEVETNVQATVLAARRCGDLLLQAKAQVEHGKFRTWLAANFAGSYRSAARYMRVARKWPEIEQSAKVPSVSHLTISEALQILSTPRPEHEADEERPSWMPPVGEMRRNAHWRHGATILSAAPSDDWAGAGWERVETWLYVVLARFAVGGEDVEAEAAQCFQLIDRGEAAGSTVVSLWRGMRVDAAADHYEETLQTPLGALAWEVVGRDELLSELKFLGRLHAWTRGECQKPVDDGEACQTCGGHTGLHDLEAHGIVDEQCVCGHLRSAHHCGLVGEPAEEGHGGCADGSCGCHHFTWQSFVLRDGLRAPTVDRPSSEEWDEARAKRRVSQ